MHALQCGFKLTKLDTISSPEAKLVHGDGEVPRLVVAMVEVAVVHRDQVHIAEDEAVVLGVLQSLRVADVQQLGTVESVLTQLQNKRTDIDPSQFWICSI